MMIAHGSRSFSKKLETLSSLSKKNALDPISDINFLLEPSREYFWMSEQLISIYGTPHYDQLTIENRRKLSQLEFSLLCSLSCTGEAEVVSAVMQLLMKPYFEPIRHYLYFFIKEENNHIYMFNKFCKLYGKLYPIHYSHIIPKDWENPLVNDLVIFIHILVFEELINDINRILAKDESLPPLIREINRAHSMDEGRHIAFGRQILESLVEELRKDTSKETFQQLQDHVENYLSVRHFEYHNVDVYREVGIEDALELRQHLVTTRSIDYFARDKSGKEKLLNILKFLHELELLKDPYLKET